ncbi:MAG: gliding motility protein GldN [Tannerella sp.]|jgi:gliding motility associated protien GldN|nr:gliding motility protein GldN [Tannerella sp.]
MKKFSLIAAIVIACTTLFAQDDQGSTMDQPVRPPLETPWAKVTTGGFSEPIPYQPTRESDVAYFITIWRTIDLREKINHPLYFPTDVKGTWRSLGQLIFDAIDIKNPDNPNALPVYNSEFCNHYMSREEIITAVSNTQIIEDLNEWGEAIGTKEVFVEYTAKEIYSYRLKEIWFFDKQRSVLDVRILEIEPMLEVERASTGQATEEEGDDYVEAIRIPKRIGYIMYDELRPYLAQQEMFNMKNNAQRLSLDDALTFKRQFVSFIYAEDNVYGRWINEYIENPRDQRLESERITNEIRVFEHDLWEF